MEHSGIWTVRVGHFGAPDRMTRGGVVAVDRGRLVGGDSNLAYVGTYAVEGTALSGKLHVIRHGDPAYVTIFGTTEAEYDLEFVGERLRAGYYEGRLFRRPTFEGRIVMRRLADLPRLQQDVRPLVGPCDAITLPNSSVGWRVNGLRTDDKHQDRH